MGRYCCENDIKPRKRGKLFLVEVKGFVNPQSRQVAELGVKPWISGSTVLLVNRPELVSISSHVRIPPHTTFYVNYLSDPWWSFWLNLFLNDPKQNLSQVAPVPHRSIPPDGTRPILRRLGSERGQAPPQSTCGILSLLSGEPIRPMQSPGKDDPTPGNTTHASQGLP